MQQIRYLLVIVVFLLGIHFQPWYWFIPPEASYRLITGNKLPEGVKAINFGTQMNDNLFHVGYYWEFEHTPAGLELLREQLHTGFEFEDYTDTVDYQKFDAIWKLPAFEEVFEKSIPTSNIGKGYEFTDNNSRDDWLLVDKNGAVSYLEWN